MRYASIRSLDISNGEGVGVALFVQGCPFHCKGCFNQETWDYDGGKEWTNDIALKFIHMIDNRPHISRVSILGGEPLCDANVNSVKELIGAIHFLFPEKKIWLYTGYTWEEIMAAPITPLDMARIETLQYVDVLCEGRFILDKQDINHKTNPWVGSTNQRVIDAHKSIEQNEVVLYKGVLCTE